MLGALVLGLLFASAPAAASADPTLRIASPKQDALVPRESGGVAVRIVARNGAARPTAELRWSGGGKALVKLKRRSAGVFVGTLGPRQLRKGRNHLFVTAPVRGGGELAESAHFSVAKRKRAVLGLKVLPGSASSPARARINVGRSAIVRARLNGKSISGLFKRRDGNLRTAVLAAHNGLRFGANRLVVTALHADRGEYRRLARHFTVRRAWPLVGAGPDRVGDTRTGIRLDGSKTKPGRGKLEMSWRIVRKPAGSKARLRGAQGPRPHLVAAAPGRYRVALSASQRPHRGAGARASAVSARVSDVAEVCVRPNVLPSGIPIETIVSTSTPRVTVGEQTYELENPKQNWAQLVVLDSCSLEEVSNTAIPAAAGLYGLEDALGSLQQGQLAILSGGGAPLYAASEELSQLRTLLSSMLGAALAEGSGWGDIDAVASGAFSIISVAGAPPGTATQLIGMSRAAGVPAGDISGYLQLGSSGEAFSFSQTPTFVKFDTMAPGSNAMTNTIMVGDQSYTAKVPPGNSLQETGFHLVWLDAASLAKRGELAFSTVSETQGMYKFAEALGKIADEPSPALIVVSSFGSPSFEEGFNCCAYNTQPLATVAEQLERFGANRYAFLGLNGSGGYSFVGATELRELSGPNAGTELVQGLAGSKSARVTGVLAPNNQGIWLPTANGSPTSPSANPVGQTELAKLLSEPAQPFKPLEPDSQMAAQRYIYEKLRLGGKAGGKGFDPKFGIRRVYWQGGAAFNASAFAAFRSELKELEPCKGPSACSKNFAAVRKQLLREFAEVSAVKEFFTDDGEEGTIARIFSDASNGTDGVGFDSIVTYITSLYEMPPTSPSGPDLTTIVDDSLGVAGGVVGMIPLDEDADPAAGFYVAQDINDLVADATQTSGGVPAFDAVVFQGEALEWGKHLEDLANEGIASLETVAKLFVSDEGRLNRLNELIRTSPQEGGFDFEAGEQERLVTAIQRSQAKYLWSTMLPLPLIAYNGRCSSPHNEQWPGTTSVNVAANVLYPGQSPETFYGALLRPMSTTGEAPTGGPVLPSLVKVLFDPVPTSGIKNSDPVGFKEPFFLSEAGGAASAGANPGFTYMSATRNFALGELEGCTP